MTVHAALLCAARARIRTLATLAVVVLAPLGSALASASPALAHGRACPNAHTSIRRASRPAVQRAVVCLLNRERHARGLPSLRESTLLNRSAQGWTNTMVGDRAFSHGADFASRITAVGFHWSSVGENIATGFSTPATVVRAWMASTGHCQNILNPTFRFVGTGVDDSSISGYSSRAGTWTNDFGLLLGQPAASENWGPAQGCPYR